KCKYIFKGLDIFPGISAYGLPNSVSSYFQQTKADFRYRASCNSDSVFFSPEYNDTFFSNTWNVRKNGLIIHSSADYFLKYRFADTGIFNIQLIINSDTAEKGIFIEPQIFADNKIVVCNQDSLI